MKKQKILKLAVLSCLILLLAGGLYWFIHVHNRPMAQAPTGPTPEQIKQQSDTDAAQKKQAVENPPSTQPSPAPTSSNISLTAKQESNGSVTVTANLGHISNGTCKLDVTNGAKTTSQTADVIYQPEFSSCAGFSVPVSSEGSGMWTIKLTVTSNGTSASQTITSEVN